jgi:hypothetical protein
MNIQICVRVTAEQRRRIEILADEDNRTLAGVLRQYALAEARRRHGLQESTETVSSK